MHNRHDIRRPTGEDCQYYGVLVVVVVVVVGRGAGAVADTLVRTSSTME
jgi:hypothetical protein